MTSIDFGPLVLTSIPSVDIINIINEILYNGTFKKNFSFKNLDKSYKELEGCKRKVTQKNSFCWITYLSLNWSKKHLEIYKGIFHCKQIGLEIKQVGLG